MSREAAGLAGTRALVVGFGTSGRAAAAALRAEGAWVRVGEARAAEELSPATLAEAAELGVDLRAGGHREEDLDGVSLIVASPGVPGGADILRWARDRGLPVWSELELGSRLCRVPYLAVTGTNGKTTTVELLAAMLREAGLRATACGNVGYPFSTAAREDVDVLVVEASSFQLAFHETFHPRVSVLLNLAPDHLDWHGSFDDYARAKARIHELQGDGDVHVGSRDDDAAARVSRSARCPTRWFRAGPPSDGEVGLEEGVVVAAADGARRRIGRPPLDGPLAVDAAAATAAALAFGVEPAAIGRALGAARRLPHRGEVVAEARTPTGGIRFVDDSKATNPHATLAALRGREHAVLVAGGLAKGVDLSPLAAAAGSLAAVVAIGEAGPELARVFDGTGVLVRRAGSIDEAVSFAYEEAHPDGVILLAPACASQDMFRDYRDRGERFAAAARDLVRRLGAGDEPGLADEDARRLHAR